jgi:PilZ domain-containing protein
MSFGVTCFDRTYFPDTDEMSPSDLKRLIIEANLAMAEAKGKTMLSDLSSEEDTLAPDKNRTSIFQPGLMRENTENQEEEIPPVLPTAEEKRRYPRYMTSLSLIYKIDNGHRVTKTLNLSLGGAKISTDHILSDGNTLELTVILGKSAFRCKGEIVYSVKSGEGFSVCYSGLKFWDLSLNDRCLLENYISSLTVKKPRLF